MITPEIAELIGECQEGGGVRPPKRRPPKRPAGPRLDPAAREALNALTRQLAASTPERRRELVAAVLSQSGPAELAAVVESVLRALLRSRSADARAGLADALSAVGPPAVLAVRLALPEAKAGWQQAALAGVLMAVGPGLPAGEQMTSLLTLIEVIERADDAAVTAVARAAAVVRLALESAPGR